jgi:hypothetical protein
MTPKRQFPEREAATKPGQRSKKGAKAPASEAPTLPPPPPEPTGRKSGDPTVSGVRPSPRKTHAATVDEVTADMTHDPRRERDD